MKTAMQELIEWLEQNEIYYNKELILKLKQTLVKEKEQIMDAFGNKERVYSIDGKFTRYDAERYYNETYNQNK